MPRTPISTVAREWGRIGLTGFGGPPAHIALLRPLMTERLEIMDPEEFQDANAACGLLPGPASTQMAIFCAYRAAGPAGAVVGGLAFILPAVLLIVALSVVFLAGHQPAWIMGAGAGAGAAVPAVALEAARGFLLPSLAAVRTDAARRLRWAVYVIAGAVAAVWLGPFMVLVLLGCGAAELLLRAPPRPDTLSSLAAVPAVAAIGGLGPLAWTALKVGALSFGGGFVIVPLMQGDAVHAYHWMDNAHFLNAVALGQITPGPVVATVAAVGYAAHGILGAAMAATIAFAPSFCFVLFGGRRFGTLRRNVRARAFLDGSGPAAIGAILGAAVLLTGTLDHGWQLALLAGAIVAVLGLRRGVVLTLVGAGVLGALLTTLAGVSAAG
jgi:chromate transporter